MKPFLNIEGCQSYDLGDGHFTVLAHGRIDSDGTGPHHGDRTAQNQTSYRPNLNADVDRYVVVPPQFRESEETDVVLGCKVLVENTANGKSCLAVVGDIGPRSKWGEMSIACANALGLNPSPVSGGTEARIIRYTYFTGTPAVLDGKTYHLQPA